MAHWKSSSGDMATVCKYSLLLLLISGENMAAARPVSGVIHEPQSVLSDLEASPIHAMI